jgi:hypothetical protein
MAGPVNYTMRLVVSSYLTVPDEAWNHTVVKFAPFEPLEKRVLRK